MLARQISSGVWMCLLTHFCPVTTVPPPGESTEGLTKDGSVADAAQSSSNSSNLQQNASNRTCGGQRPIFSKCCPEKEALALVSNVYWICTKFDSSSEISFNLTYINHVKTDIDVACCDIQSGTYIKYPFPLSAENGDNYTIERNSGHLQYYSATQNQVYDRTKFCLEVKITEQENVTVAWMSGQPTENGSSQVKRFKTWCETYTIQSLQFLSIPFLVATLVVVICFDRSKKFHRHVRACLVLSLLIAFTARSVITSAPLFTDNSLEGPFCMIVGLIMIFAFPASFFWLNVMCFEFWWTFGGTTVVRGSTPNICDRWAFTMSALYAWGCPLLITCITFIVDQWGDQLPVPELMHPRFHRGGDSSLRNCYFNNGSANLLYMVLPNGIVLTLNLLLFAMTWFRINSGLNVWQHRKSQKHQKERRRSALFLRLFLLMGINWFIDMISALPLGEDEDVLTLVRVLLDHVQCSVGIFIFAILVCNRRTMRQISKKFCPHSKLFKGTNLKSYVRPTTTTNTLRQNTSSYNISKSTASTEFVSSKRFLSSMEENN